MYKEVILLKCYKEMVFGGTDQPGFKIITTTGQHGMVTSFQRIQWMPYQHEIKDQRYYLKFDIWLGMTFPTISKKPEKK